MLYRKTITSARHPCRIVLAVRRPCKNGCSRIGRVCGAEGIASLALLRMAYKQLSADNARLPSVTSP